MTPLPRALLAPAPDLPLPADPRGVLVPAARIGETDIRGAIVMVEPQADIATLRKALAAGAAMIALDGCRTGADLQRLATVLSVAEAETGRVEGGTSILALTDGILPAPASRESLAGKSRRLAGLVWNQAALASTLGLDPSRTEAGDCSPALAGARAATLLTAAAAGIPAYDSMLQLDDDAFALRCKRSRAEGFRGCLTRAAARMDVIETLYRR